MTYTPPKEVHATYAKKNFLVEKKRDLHQKKDATYGFFRNTYAFHSDGSRCMVKPPTTHWGPSAFVVSAEHPMWGQRPLICTKTHILHKMPKVWLYAQYGMPFQQLLTDLHIFSA